MSDFEPVDTGDGKADGISPTSFDPNEIVNEAFFTNIDAVDAAGVQRFFESTPYNRRSFLADETINGVPVAEHLVTAARDAGINPVVILARMQVEKGLVGKTVRPTGNAWDFAFGCGCYDNQPCMESYRGFDKQIACAADTTSSLHARSVDGSGQWRKGVRRKTLDPKWVTPVNHATAALYGYTPWVAEGSGGNWLVWNIVRRYAVHFDGLGLLNTSGSRSAWIGSACSDDYECDFVQDGEQGYCLLDYSSGGLTGICTIGCQGYCPDRSGYAGTFCTSMDGGYTGNCVATAGPLNDDCEASSGTSLVYADRFVGFSGAPDSSAWVCAF